MLLFLVKYCRTLNHSNQLPFVFVIGLQLILIELILVLSSLKVWCSLHRSAEIWLRKLTGIALKCTTGRARVILRILFGRRGDLEKVWRVGVVHLVVIACVLRATTKQGRRLFLRRKSAPQTKSWLPLWMRLLLTLEEKTNILKINYYIFFSYRYRYWNIMCEL